MIRHLLLAWAAALALAAAGAHAQSAAAPKTLRYAFPIAETGFDPAQISDLYSRTVASGIFDAPLEFAFMAWPAQMRPNTAAAMPEVSDDFTSFTFRIKPGIHFADDPAFGGRKRELVAEDYVYSLKRHYDPRWKSANLYLLENAKLLGLSELRKKSLDGKTPFDYDTPVAGLEALDRYTFRIRLAEPQPRFLYNMADGSFTGAMAREVVEAYGDKIGEHPVGTGPVSPGRMEAQLAHAAGAGTRTTARCCTTRRRRPATRGWRRSPPNSRAGACRCSTRCRSR